MSLGQKVHNWYSNVSGINYAKAKNTADVLSEATVKHITPEQAHLNLAQATRDRFNSRLGTGAAIVGLSGSAYLVNNAYQKHQKDAIMNNISKGYYE